ncbi:hypothetical protein K2173_023631 [Erythroxylum novogranatense]|uniref:Lachrymatory factor synthase n=1 Tax=Erythroxylum novogranatense TaxID=1862640 RepID=A0AAV8TP34_9ROSI|nr:hypothetical protein K2173_023631 [Erythroxylum novogranatense]
MESVQLYPLDHPQQKWEGNAWEELSGIKAEQVWPLLVDFCGLNKWFPALPTCLLAEGINGQPGCVRYCAGFKTHLDNGEDGVVNWTKQKLLSVDREQMSLTYCIIDGNVGFQSYLATWKVTKIEGGCRVEWRYEVEPVDGWKPEDLSSFVRSGLRGMAIKIAQVFQA